MKKGHSRAVAIRLMNASTKAVKAVKAAVKSMAKQVKAERKAERKPNNSECTFHRPTTKQREHIDDLIRAAIRKQFGHVVAVEKPMLGSRYSNSVVGGQPYERYLLENGHTLFVGGFLQDEFTISISEKKADPKKGTLKTFLERKARKQSREEQRLIKLSEKTEWPKTKAAAKGNSKLARIA